MGNVLKIIGVMVAAFVLLVIGQLGFGAVSSATSTLGLVPSFVLSAIIGLGLVVFGTSLFNRLVLKGSLPELIGPDNKAGGTIIPKWFVFGLAMIWGLIAIFWISGFGYFQTYYQETVMTGLAISACVALMSGISEEILFRYLVYGYMRDKMPKLWAALICGAVFGALHLNQVANVQDGAILMIAAIGVSLLFAAIYERTGTIWAPALVHVAWNMFAIKIGFVVTNGFDNPEDAGFAYAGFHIEAPNSFLAGGSFGVEQSAPAILMYFVLAFAIIQLGRRGKEQSAA